MRELWPVIMSGLSDIPGQEVHKKCTHHKVILRACSHITRLQDESYQTVQSHKQSREGRGFQQEG